MMEGFFGIQLGPRFQGCQFEPEWQWNEVGLFGQFGQVTHVRIDPTLLGVLI
jgi:hypothetical protein